MSITNKRVRYIAFQINLLDSEKTAEFSRKEMISALKQSCYQLFKQPCKTYDIYLTRFQKNRGIIRCQHTEKQRLIHLLKTIEIIAGREVKIQTIGASGTIKTCCKKFFQGQSLK